MFNSEFKLCKENYNAFLDMFPSWVIEAANLLIACKGYNAAYLVAAPQYRIPVHDALHVYTGIETTPSGEDCIAVLEDYLLKKPILNKELLEEALLCWERVPSEYKEFFIEFYSDERNVWEIDIDFYEYFEEYKTFLWEKDKDFFNSLFNR